MYQEPIVHAERDRRAWIRILAPYREPRCARSILEIMTTALPLVLHSDVENPQPELLALSSSGGAGRWVAR
jgi:hypothetical protein